MGEPHFYHSESCQYDLGLVDLSKALEIAEDLSTGMRGTARMHEAVALQTVAGRSGDFLDDRLSRALHILRSDLVVKTEQLYVDASTGRLTAAVQDVDERDKLLETPTSLLPLAHFSKSPSTEGITLEVRALSQLGIDPSFLYNLGVRYGKRLEPSS